jgi:AP-4 complex subunit sigma-1
MTIKFLLLVNKQGQTRLAKYFTEFLTTEERRALEGEIVRKCLSRTDKQVAQLAHVLHVGLAKLSVDPVQCSFVELRQYKIIYRRYASLFFMVGVDDEEVRDSALQSPAE